MILGEHVKTAVVFLADGFEEVEALSPVDYLRRAGVEVTTLATGKDGLELTGARGIPVRADMKLTDYLAKNISPDLVVVPGGMPGAVNVASCKEANELIKRQLSEKKLIAAICASPAVVLAPTGALEGHKWTCYPGMVDYSPVSASFAEKHVDGVPFVSDGNLVTACGAGAAEEFSMELVRLLCGEEVMTKVKKSTCQR